MPKPLLTPEVVRKSLLKAGVKNLKEYGYPSVNDTNILVDKIYKGFFLSMLNENLGQVPGQAGKMIDAEIKKLQAEVK